MLANLAISGLQESIRLYIADWLGLFCFLCLPLLYNTVYLFKNWGTIWIFFNGLREDACYLGAPFFLIEIICVYREFQGLLNCVSNYAEKSRGC